MSLAPVFTEPILCLFSRSHVSCRVGASRPRKTVPVEICHPQLLHERSNVHPVNTIFSGTGRPQVTQWLSYTEKRVYMALGLRTTSRVKLIIQPTRLCWNPEGIREMEDFTTVLDDYHPAADSLLSNSKDTDIWVEQHLQQDHDFLLKK